MKKSTYIPRLLLGGFAIILLVNVVFSCKAREYKLNELSGSVLVAAEGGGFAGIEHRYLLQESGWMFYQVGTQEKITRIARLSTNQTAQLFKIATDMDIWGANFNKPGNTYNVLEIIESGKSNRLVWDSYNEQVPYDWKNLNEILMTFGKKNNKN